MVPNEYSVPNGTLCRVYITEEQKQQILESKDGYIWMFHPRPEPVNPAEENPYKSSRRKSL